MADDLLSAADLTDYPGAPFTEDVVASAAARVRSEARWHIAPARTETLTLDSDGGCVLWLPTRYLTEVTEIRDITGAAPVVITGWRKSTKGKLTLSSGWPCGLEAVEVDVVHGYTECPPELLPIIAGYCLASTTDQDVSQESLGSWSVTQGQQATTGAQDDSAALSALSLPWGFE